MPRYKEFNEIRFSIQAMKYFWRNGFERTSINQIVKATGVNRFSIYDSFESKEGLLDFSLKTYREQFIDQRIDKLKNEGESYEDIFQFYKDFISPPKELNLPRGCYICILGTELADGEPVVKEHLQSYLENIKSAFAGFLERIGFSPKEVERHAESLLGLFCAISTMTPISSEADCLQYVKEILSIIILKEKINAKNSRVYP